jgi:hypothetical protein
MMIQPGQKRLLSGKERHTLKNPPPLGDDGRLV